MDDAVDDGYGNVVIMKKASPRAELLIGRQDDRAVLIKAVDELEEVVTPLLVHRQVA